MQRPAARGRPRPLPVPRARGRGDYRASDAAATAAHERDRVLRHALLHGADAAAAALRARTGARQGRRGRARRRVPGRNAARRAPERDGRSPSRREADRAGRPHLRRDLHDPVRGRHARLGARRRPLRAGHRQLVLVDGRARVARRRHAGRCARAHHRQGVRGRHRRRPVRTGARRGRLPGRRAAHVRRGRRRLARPRRLGRSDACAAAGHRAAAVDAPARLPGSPRPARLLVRGPPRPALRDARRAGAAAALAPRCRPCRDRRDVPRHRGGRDGRQPRRRPGVGPPRPTAAAAARPGRLPRGGGAAAVADERRAARAARGRGRNGVRVLLHAGDDDALARRRAARPRLRLHVRPRQPRLGTGSDGRRGRRRRRRARDRRRAPLPRPGRRLCTYAVRRMEQARLDRLDDVVGDAVERLVVRHHRRRLRRLEADLAAATSSILLAGWTFTPSFRLSPAGLTLRELLAELAERIDVRVLVWAGAPLPLFEPSRKQVAEMREALVKGTRIRMALDARERPMHCHHEKLAVVDGRVAYVGGIDLTTLGGDRLDTSVHPARGDLGWHDATARIEGPLVDDVAAHIVMRWREVTGERLEAPRPGADATAPGSVRAQLVRTVPEHCYDALPHGDFRILEAYVRALRSAERLIYLESQFLWAPEVVAILAEKLKRPPSDEFRLVVLLPARAKNGDDDTRGQLGLLVDADRHDRLLACSLFQPGRVEQVYVHAKVAVVDDRWLCIGSANLNDHSLFNDTEVCLITCDEELARATRVRLWREHLDRDEADGPPAQVVDELWRPIAEGEQDRVTLLPGVSRRSAALLGPINGLLVDG